MNDLFKSSLTVSTNKELEENVKESRMTTAYNIQIKVERKSFQ